MLSREPRGKELNFQFIIVKLDLNEKFNKLI